MKILINCRHDNGRGYGLSVYTGGLIAAIKKTGAKNNFEFLSPPGRLNKSGFLSLLWEHVFVPFILVLKKVDIYHNPDHILPILPIKCKKVITVHDLAFVRYPKLYNFTKRIYKQLITPYSLKRADAIIAVSENTKKDIIKRYKIDPCKIFVVYNGAGKGFFKIGDKTQLDTAKKKYGLPDRYILFVGTLEPRKNVVNLIKAYAKAKTGYDLVIAGKKGWLSGPIIDEIHNFNGQNKILWINNLETKDLPAVYNLASLFVYPSFYEGFGLPVIEAMACGTPAITSNVSSLPEVAGNAAVLIDPNNIGELASAIRDVCNNEKLREDLITKGLEQAKKFSWDKCARETLEVYEQVIKKL